MRLTAPWWLALGLLLLAALVAGVVLTSRPRAAALAAAGVAAGRGRPAVGPWLSLAGLAVLVVAVARPAAIVPVSRTAGTVIVVVDVSNSMAATDPTRPASTRRSGPRPRSCGRSRRASTSASSRSRTAQPPDRGGGQRRPRRRSPPAPGW